MIRTAEHEGPALILPMAGNATLLFGLRWFPLIGSRVDELARQRARALRATHYVYGGAPAAAVGCTRIGASAVGHGPCYAAAQVFARMHPEGIVASLLALDDGRVWFAAAQDGAVMTRADRIYATPAQAAQAIADLQQQFPDPAVTVYELDVDTLSRSADVAASLWRLSGPLRMFGRYGPFARLPVAARILAIGAPLAAACTWVYRAYAPASRDMASQSVAPVDEAARVAAAWREVVDRQAAATPLHDAQRTGLVFTALRQLPVDVSGWRLKHSRCRPAMTGWSCSAHYGREHPQASNRALAAALPQDRRPEFHDLELASVSWAIAAEPAGMALRSLPSARRVELEFASALQRLKPIFVRIALGPPVALSLPAPLGADGRPLPPSPDVPRIRTRKLLLQGPLRSFALWADAAGPGVVGANRTSWSEIGMHVVEATTPGARTSVLMADVQGTVYERE
jgi:hypothetical protein